MSAMGKTSKGISCDVPLLQFVAIEPLTVRVIRFLSIMAGCETKKITYGI